jgi:hypothetical protein
MKEAILLAVLDKIEEVVADDFSESLDYDATLHPERLTERERVLARKISAIYRLAHGFNDLHSCHHVHADWREGFEPRVSHDDRRAERRDRGPVGLDS